MRLATLRDGTRDGALVVVGRDGDRCARAAAIAPTLQAALDDWERAAPALAELAAELDAGGRAIGEPLDVARLAPPLPRAYEWIDGSAFLIHVIRVRKARGAEPPADARERSARLPGRLGRAARPARRHPARTIQPGGSTSRARSPRSSATRRRDDGRGRGAARAPADARQRPHPATAGLVRAGARASASSSRSRRPRFRRSRSRPTSWAPRGTTAASTCRVRTFHNGALVGDPNAGRDALLVLRSRSSTSRARARSRPAPSWAAARCRTPIARAACRAWSSAARSS